MCLGCHADPAGSQGPSFHLSDGVGCEACHGGASGWIAGHYAVGANHATNVARGMVPLDDPRARASQCLDCHFGSSRPGQFVDHRIMAAGHPRIAFELDLFSTLDRHWDEDADYAQRKRTPSSVKTWAMGQATAVSRATTLFANARLGSEGMFPEFYFFDCQTCHRRISDDPDYRPTAIANPGRPIPPGMPAFQDENMIMLSAAVAVAAPALAGRLDADLEGLPRRDRRGSGRRRSRRRAGCARSAQALADAFGGSAIGRGETFAIIDSIASNAITSRLTDYEGSAQSVMAIDTLLNALVRLRLCAARSGHGDARRHRSRLSGGAATAMAISPTRFPRRRWPRRRRR